MKSKSFSEILTRWRADRLSLENYKEGLKCFTVLICENILQGRVFRKPVNANPGLKVDRSINFSCLKVFFTAYVLCGYQGLHNELKTEEQTI